MALEEVTRHAVDVLPHGGLEEKLKRGRPLRVKLGIDPTSPDVHLGFAYVLDRLADFRWRMHHCDDAVVLGHPMVGWFLEGRLESEYDGARHPESLAI